MSKKLEDEAKNINQKSLKGIEEDKSFQILKLAHDASKEKYKLASNEILSLIEEKPISKDLLPISIFDNKELSCLETVVKYLKEEFKLRFSKIK